MAKKKIEQSEMGDFEEGLLNEIKHDHYLSEEDLMLNRDRPRFKQESVNSFRESDDSYMQMRRQFEHRVQNDEHRDSLWVPPEEIPDDVVYFWGREECLGWKDESRISDLYMEMWRPVPASRHPSLIAGGNEARMRNNVTYIFNGGLVLYEREKYLHKLAMESVRRDIDKVESNMEGVEGGGPNNWRREQAMKEQRIKSDVSNTYF